MNSAAIPSATPIPAFNDNYIWLVQCGHEIAVVDPGDGEVVANYLNQRRLSLDAIWITHHHPDHIGGIERLRSQWPSAIYGPASSPAEALFTHTLQAGDLVDIGSVEFCVLAVPGHTLDHIAFYSAEAAMLFCGDTLFAGGCGRVFEGTFAQMNESLEKLAALPGETAVYCAHEYTLSNLAFARAAEPDNSALIERLAQAQQQRADALPTVPSTIALERATNPFLRCQAPASAKQLLVPLEAAGYANVPLSSAAERFAALRRWKDSF